MKMHLTWAVMIGLGLGLYTGCSSTPKAKAPAPADVSTAKTTTQSAVSTPKATATAQDDLTSLQGAWAGQEGENGQGPSRLTIAGDALKFEGAGGQEWYEAKLVLHPGTTPKQAEVQIQKCCEPKYNQQTAKAIYKLEGKKLTIAATEPGADNGPSDFEPSSWTRVMVFTRP